MTVHLIAGTLPADGVDALQHMVAPRAAMSQGTLSRTCRSRPDVKESNDGRVACLRAVTAQGNILTSLWWPCGKTCWAQLSKPLDQGIPWWSSR